MNLDDAYANAAHIPDGAAFPARWAAAAAAFRAGQPGLIGLPYGTGPRQVLDLFVPPRPALGLVVFVHGGYWRMFDKSTWSHLAAGPLAAGWAVAMPSYDLCPTVRITGIGRQIAAAIAAAAERVPGPIRLCGHSAGGHLVARLNGADIAPAWRQRVARILPISPLADLAPLMQTAMNADLRIDAAEALAESPVHLAPAGAPVTVWVGGAERPAFLDQARRLATAWGAGLVIDPARHHFDVIDGLARADSPLTRALVA